MAVREIVPGVFYVGAIDWDRRLFDALIPLPDGTSYNSYLIRGKESIALIDTVDPSKTSVLFENLNRVGITKIDYIIVNHAEQDHSGSLPALLDRYESAKVVTNAKCKDFLKDLLLIDEERFITVADGETLDLGGKTLEFIIAPWVHWPETMFTYLKEDGILFPCDFLGSHLAPPELLVDDISSFYEGAKRYYAEIMMPFRTNVRKHLSRIANYEIKIIAPSHGPIHMNPAPIIEAYQQWSSDDVKNEVVIAYVSMHGSTERMVMHLADTLISKGISVRIFNLTRTDVGKLAEALVDAATLVIGAPTVLVGPHPVAVYATYLTNALRPKTRFAGVIGSFGWGSKMLETIKGMLTNLKLELLSPVIVKGYPKSGDLQALESLANEIYEKHKSIGIAT